MSAKNPYEHLLSYWMEYQWSIRDVVKARKSRDTVMGVGEELFNALDRQDEAERAWRREVGNITTLKIEHLPDGSCVVAGTMFFAKY